MKYIIKKRKLKFWHFVMAVVENATMIVESRDLVDCKEEQ